MKKLLVVVVVVLVLLGVADRVAVQIADRRLATQLAGQLGTTPDVSISGFPFLTQALAGRYRSIEVRGNGVRRQGLRITRFTADLNGVQVPLSDAIRGQVTRVPVDTLQGRAFVSYDDLAAAVPGRNLTFDAQGDQVRVTGRLTLLGQTLTASALASARLQGGSLVLTGQQYQVGGQPVSGVVGSALAGKLDVSVPLRNLPYGARLTSVKVGQDGLSIAASARDLVLRP